MGVSCYLQAVAASQSHLVEILARLASGPLLARRDACLDASDLDSEFKRSLRVQPIESGTVVGSKFQEVVRQYKEGPAHKSLQMAVVGANKRQPSFRKSTPKTPDTPAKPAFSEPNVSMGSILSRTSTFSQGKTFNRFHKKKTVKTPYFNRLPKILDQSTVPLKGVLFVFQALPNAVYNYFKHLVPRAELPTEGRISSFLKA